MPKTNTKPCVCEPYLEGMVDLEGVGGAVFTMFGTLAVTRGVPTCHVTIQLVELSALGTSYTYQHEQSLHQMLSSERDTQQVRYSVDKTESLLASHPCHDGGDSTNTTASTLVNRTAEAAAKKPFYTKTHFVILITLIIFIIDVALGLFNAPQTEIFEHIICNAYYKSNSAILTANRSDWMKATGNSSCVVDAVQLELAILTQFKVTLDMLPCKSS